MSDFGDPNARPTDSNHIDLPLKLGMYNLYATCPEPTRGQRGVECVHHYSGD